MKLGLVLALALAGPGAGAEAGEAETEAETDEGEADEVEAELVLIHIAPDRPAIRARLQAELGLLGFVSERLELSDDGKVLGPDLIDRLPSAGADVAIEIALTSDLINVWVADGTTGKTLNRRFDLLSNPELADPRTLAISAVELLRASRLEIEAEQDPFVAGIDHELPPEDEPAPKPARSLRGAISLGPLVTGSSGKPGSFGAAAHIELAGRWAPLERFALRFSLWVPTVATHFENAEGRAQLRYGMIFVEPQLRLPGGASWFHPDLGLGLGLAAYYLQGDPNPPLVAEPSSLQVGFVGHAHLGLGFAFTPRVWLRLDAYVGVLQPQPRVQFSELPVATWGLPWGTGSIGLELWF